MDEALARTALNTIVDALQPLQSPDRKRAVLGALHFLGEEWSSLPDRTPPSPEAGADVADSATDSFEHAVQAWMKKNDLSADDVEQVFAFEDGKINIIADLPGKGKRENTIVIYTLMGVGIYLYTGQRKFSDDAAREACVQHNAYDSKHHAETMKDLKNELTGDKKSGWTITLPGLKKGASILKAIAATSK